MWEVFLAPALWALGLEHVGGSWGSQCFSLPIFVKESGGVQDPHAQEISVPLHGRGWLVGAGAVELDLRLGGAARQAKYFLIWQLPPVTYHLQTRQIASAGLIVTESTCQEAG